MSTGSQESEVLSFRIQGSVCLFALLTLFNALSSNLVDILANTRIECYMRMLGGFLTSDS